MNQLPQTLRLSEIIFVFLFGFLTALVDAPTSDTGNESVSKQMFLATPLQKWYFYPHPLLCEM